MYFNVARFKKGIYPLTVVVCRVDVDIPLQQLLGGSLDRKTHGQDQRRRTVVHARIQVRSPIRTQDVDHSLCVCADRRVKRSPPANVSSVGVSPCLEQAPCSICSLVATRQMQWRLLQVVGRAVDARSVVDELLDERAGRVAIFTGGATAGVERTVF